MTPGCEETNTFPDSDSFRANNDIGRILNLMKYTNKCSFPELVQALNGGGHK